MTPGLHLGGLPAHARRSGFVMASTGASVAVHPASSAAVPNPTPEAAATAVGAPMGVGDDDNELARIRQRYQERWSGGGTDLDGDEGMLIPLNTYVEEMREAEERKRKVEPVFRCELCDTTCNSDEHLQLHLQGKPHAKRKKQHEKDMEIYASLPYKENHIHQVDNGKWYCKLCDSEFPADSVKAHIEGRIHRNKIRIFNRPTPQSHAAIASASLPASSSTHSRRPVPRSPRSPRSGPRTLPSGPRCYRATSRSPRSEASNQNRQDVKRANQNAYRAPQPQPHPYTTPGNARSSRSPPLLAFPEAHPQVPRTQLPSALHERRFASPPPALNTPKPSLRATNPHPNTASFHPPVAAASSALHPPAAATYKPIRIQSRPANPPAEKPPVSPRFNPNAKEFTPSSPLQLPSSVVAPTSSSAAPIFPPPSNVQQTPVIEQPPDNRPSTPRLRPVLQPQNVAPIQSTMDNGNSAGNQLQPSGGNQLISRPSQQHPLEGGDDFFRTRQQPLTVMYQTSWQQLSQSATGWWDVMPAADVGKVGESRLRADATPFKSLKDNANVSVELTENCSALGLTSHQPQMLSDPHPPHVSPIVEEAAAAPMVDASHSASCGFPEMLAPTAQSYLSAASTPFYPTESAAPTAAASRIGGSSVAPQGNVGHMTNLAVRRIGLGPSSSGIRPLQLIGNTQAGPSSQTLHAPEDVDMLTGFGTQPIGAVHATPSGYNDAVTLTNLDTIFPAADSNIRYTRSDASSPRPQPPQKKKKKGGGGEFFYCYLCEVNCSSQANLDEHMKSQKHQKKLKGPSQPSDMMKCEICDVDVFGKDNWESHVAGAKHKKKAQQAEAQNLAAAHAAL